MRYPELGGHNLEFAAVGREHVRGQRGQVEQKEPCGYDRSEQDKYLVSCCIPSRLTHGKPVEAERDQTHDEDESCQAPIRFRVDHVGEEDQQRPRCAEGPARKKPASHQADGQAEQNGRPCAGKTRPLAEDACQKQSGPETRKMTYEITHDWLGPAIVRIQQPLRDTSLE